MDVHSNLVAPAWTDASRFVRLGSRSGTRNLAQLESPGPPHGQLVLQLSIVSQEFRQWFKLWDVIKEEKQ